MTEKNTRDSYLVGMENRLAVLEWLNTYGSLTTRQLARLVWPHTATGLRMAQRTVHDLLKRKLILRRGLPNGGCVYVLGESGARLRRENGYDDASSRGHRDLTFKKPLHRLIANEFAIDQHRRGLRVWPEFQIQRRRAPVPEIIVKKHPKIPDVVTDANGNFCWIEVENAFKSQKRLTEMVAVANRLFGSETSGFIKYKDTRGVYEQMVFVAANLKRLVAVLRCFQAAVDRHDTTWDVLNHIEVVQVDVTAQYRWNGVVGAASAQTVLRAYESLDATQIAVRARFPSDALSPMSLTDDELWRHCIFCFEATKLPLDRVSQLLNLEITDYHQLESLPEEVVDRLDRSWMVNYLQQIKDDYLRGKLEFTPKFLSKHMVPPARI